MRIQVNGEAREVEDNISLSQLIAGLNLKAEQVAIEINHDVVRRAQWDTTMLQAEDQIEIVHFVGGGCGPGRTSNEKGSRQTAVASL